MSMIGVNTRNKFKTVFDTLLGISSSSFRDWVNNLNPILLNIKLYPEHKTRCHQPNAKILGKN
jgi:hypothetical protein